MSSSRIPLPSLRLLCRTLKHGLKAGLSPLKIFRQQAKSGPVPLRSMAASVADGIKNGRSLADSFAPFGGKLPMLFMEMIAVGEKSGKLPEVFEELERYYDSQIDARRTFIQAITWPVMSYIAAVVVVAIMVLVLGLIGGKFDPLGLKLLGPTGAMIVLGLGFGVLGVLAFLYYASRDNDNLKCKLEAFGIKIPGLAVPYRSFALYRFSLALGMTHEAGLRADEAVHASFQATTNAAYRKHAEPTAVLVHRGSTIAKALKKVPRDLIPENYLDSVYLAESSGQITEVMGRVAEEYREAAVRATKLLARIAGGLVYGMVGIMIIVVIIRIIMSIAGVYQESFDYLDKATGGG